MAKFPWGIDLAAVDLRDIRVEGAVDDGRPAVHWVMEINYEGAPYVVVVGVSPEEAASIGHELIKAAENATQ